MLPAERMTSFLACTWNVVVTDRNKQVKYSHNIVQPIDHPTWLCPCVDIFKMTERLQTPSSAGSVKQLCDHRVN